MIYTRLQIALNADTDKALIEHFLSVRREHANTLKTDADVIRHILERDRQVAKVYGPAWDWRLLVKAPPWMSKILDAVKAFDGRAKIVIEDEEDASKQVIIEEGIFDDG